MSIKRRQFLKFSLSTSALTLLPQNIFAESYKGPINFAYTSFLCEYGRIQTVMPIIKGAFDISIKNSKQRFFDKSLKDSINEKPFIENLSLVGYEENAKLALTLCFAAEFDFGGFDDKEKGDHYYLLRTFAYSILYNPFDRIIVATVPIRAKMIGKVSIKASKSETWKSQILKDAFFNKDTPKNTIVEQFRIMTSKISISNKWTGLASRVTSVIIPEKYKKVFEESFPKVEYKDFINFLGQSTTAAFAYNLNLPIIPFSRTQADGEIMTVFDDTDAIEITAPFPPTQISIKPQLKGWKFKEKPGTYPIVHITLLIVIKLQIYDEGFKKLLYSQQFSARRRFIKNASGRLRSDVSEISILYEKLIDQAYRSIVDEKHRKKMAAGTGIIIPFNQFISEKYNLIVSKKDPK